MSESYLQDGFLRVFAEGHKRTETRINARLKAIGIPIEFRDQAAAIVSEELRGLYHGSLVVFDGGSCLADVGMIEIVDDTGTPFAHNLHEIGFRHYG
jgi:hypothetical protein